NKFVLTSKKGKKNPKSPRFRFTQGNIFYFQIRLRGQKMTKFNIRLFSVFAMFLLTAMTAFPQSTVTGGINGKVVDPNGAAVNGATVTVTNTGTNASVTAVSSDDGVFCVTHLQPGKYKVEISASGFGKGTSEAVVEVGTITTVDVPLKVGEATGEVTVTA